ncbi:MAG: methylated-DNA--[protein]-cysteine S-methyltransferase [Flavobacteriales bacterium]|nr:methylated-DNA--[protein]-cysteine S-methyltransferase [Flavobacteriales bacterium]
MNSAFYKSPIGWLEIVEENNFIVEIKFLDDDSISNSKKSENVLKDSVQQLEEYFFGKRTEFELPLNPKGTEFQKTVWIELQNIPFGKTISYMDMAKRLGDPKVIRAAGTANGKNPIAIIIPCHRVVGSDGSLTGYAGGLKRKQWLLEHESAQGSLF